MGGALHRPADGSPQSSLIGYHWDGTDAVLTFRRDAEAQERRAAAPCGVAVPDGRTAVTVYGDGELVEQDPARVDDYAKILASFGAPESSRERW